MTLPVLLSACVAVLQFCLGVLLLAVARAPRWGGARVFAIVTFGAAAYSASSVTWSYFPLPDGARLAGGRVAYLAASVFMAAWLVFAFGDGSGRLLAVPRWVRGLGGATLASGILSAATGWHQRAGSLIDFEVAWAHAHYRFPGPSALGHAIQVLYLLIALAVCVRFILRPPNTRRARWEYTLGFSTFFAAGVVEVLVASGLLRFPFTAEVGFVALVVPMAAETVRRFVDDARRLASVQSQLKEEIELRTHERDEAQHAWLEAERSAALGRLAAGVGHEINNPLTYLRLNIELLGEWGRKQGAPSDVLESVESALDGADRIRAVTDALRAYARPGTGARTLLSPEALIRAALRVTAHQLRDAATVELETAAAPSVLGEEAKLVQVMAHLLLNAGQATDGARDGRGCIRVRVGSSGDAWAMIEVADNGPGISRRDLRRLTQPYFTTRPGTHAAGLGLFLARGVVEQHGGALEIESAPGEGTRVRVVLPGACGVEARTSALESIAPRHATPGPDAARPPARVTTAAH